MTFNSIFLGIVGGSEVLLILLVALLLFGGRKIPELMKGLGQGIREFKNAVKGDDEPGNKDKKG
jgi:sec-independent protein translocase protein TatA